MPRSQMPLLRVLLELLLLPPQSAEAWLRLLVLQRPLHVMLPA